MPLWQGRAVVSLLAVALLLLITAPLQAEDRVLSAMEALRRAQSGDIALVDVRSPQEWGKTGIPAGAEGITIHGPQGMAGFVESIRARFGQPGTQPIALICASGVRSTAASRALEAAGYQSILNVREGLFGNQRDGAGWLRRGLPLEPCRSC